MEVWKNVPGYEGLYQVSNLGRIKRTFKNGKDRIMKGKLDKDGYIQVILSRHQTKKYCRLHRLVADAFISNAENKPQINHKDRNKRNNAVSNLEWATARENTLHCIETGRGSKTREIVQYTKNMDFVAVWSSIREASRSLNISEHNISYCCSGGFKSAGGFVWRYKEVSI